jgi:hypothetical protein
MLLSGMLLSGMLLAEGLPARELQPVRPRLAHKASRTNSQTRFAAMKGALPKVARIHQKVLRRRREQCRQNYFFHCTEKRQLLSRKKHKKQKTS